MSATYDEYTRQIEAEQAAYDRQSAAEFDRAVAAGDTEPTGGGKFALLEGAITAADLNKMVLPPIEYAVPGIIPQGASMIVAAPKIGKSWMVLGLAIAVAEGGIVFGSIRVQQRPVLYLALEDGPSRLQSRMRTLGLAAPEGLTFLTKLNGDAGDTISAFLDMHAGEKPLIILDTLGKVRGVYSGNDKYSKDYADIGSLKDRVDAHPGSSLVIVHHTNKGGREDFLDSVSGTQGIAGALDSILAIKRARGSEDGILSVTARDATEGEYSMRMVDGTWTLTGGSLEAAAAAAEMTRTTSGLGDVSERIVQAVMDAPDGITPKTVATVVEELKGDNDAASTYLSRLEKAGRIRKTGRGRYAPIPSEGVFEPFEVFETGDGDHAPSNSSRQVFERKVALTSHSDTSNTSNTPRRAA